MFRPLLKELKSHAPFTLGGATTGIALMLVLVLSGINMDGLKPFFHGFHAIHIFLSAIVTASLFRRYNQNIMLCIVVGFTGAIGIATLSDIVFPHHGGQFLLRIAGEEHHQHMHLAFIDKWWLMNPAALLGVGFALWRPTTKVPHSGHVLLSTWASLFYLLVHGGTNINWLPLTPLVLAILFVAVWVPCCLSDIVFPMLFVGAQAENPHDH
ncbi:MAG: hypothetical protein ACOCSQ_04125 [Planctomycetota bacterium]